MDPSPSHLEAQRQDLDPAQVPPGELAYHT